MLRALRERLPNADVIYFGDIVNAPYGTKSRDELTELLHTSIHMLEARGASIAVSACNSVSAAVLEEAEPTISLIEMSRPTASFLQRNFKGKRLLLLATPATVRARLYENAVGDTVTIDACAVPELASAIEFGASSNEVNEIVRAACEPFRGGEYAGIILGCTHYPLVSNEIAKIAHELFGDVPLIDPAEAVADEMTIHYPSTEGSGSVLFLISADSEQFRARVEELFPHQNYSIEVIVRR